MALTFEWDAARSNGSREVWFWHGPDHVLMHACDVIAKAWKDDKARDAWAQAEAGKIIARREYEASDAGRLALAKEAQARFADALAVKTADVEALQAKAGK